ncbi:MAG: Cof-type HAD-IIB family hydrolase [Candidatus Methylomirabilia bacterium]
MSADLLVLDLDGVVVDAAMRVDPVLEAGVRQAGARGLRVTVATGRMPPGARPYWERLGITTPVIVYNGALVRDPVKGTSLFTRSLPPGFPWKIYPIVSLARVHPLFFREEQLYCLERTAPVVKYCEEQGLTVEEISDREVFLRSGAFIKGLFIGDSAALAALREELAPALDGARLVLSRPHYLELLPAGVSKGEALKFLARHLGISLARVIAVGDQENDIEMIQTAGIGVAMSHSPPHVRAAARRVAPPPEAGGLTALLASLCPEHFAR